MGFGIDEGISRQTNNTVQVADKLDNVGTIIGMTTHGGKTEVTEEYYSETFTNEAVNGQSGTSDIVTQHNLIEDNGSDAREQITKVSALAAPAA